MKLRAESFFEICSHCDTPYEEDALACELCGAPIINTDLTYLYGMRQLVLGLYSTAFAEGFPERLPVRFGKNLPPALQRVFDILQNELRDNQE